MSATINTIDTSAKSAPLQAFRLATPLQFTDAIADERGSVLSHRCKIHARTAGIVNHWYWGRMVHDMAGCRFKDSIPIDWRHDGDELLGYSSKITADDRGLEADAVLQSIREGDRAWEVITRGKGGQPYEASIYWDEQNNLLEYLEEGWTTEVNGQTVEGPLVIVREWNLRGIAITPYGVDSSSTTKFSADGRSEIPIVLSRLEGATMTKEVKPDPTKDATPAATTTTTEAPATPQATPATATKDEQRGELARYMDRFGAERGATYYRDAVNYETALEREVEHLRKELATKDAEIKSASDRLAALKLGETSAVDTGANKDEQPKGWNSLFKMK